MPEGLKHTERTQLSCLKTASSFFVATSNIRAFLSSHAVANCVPEGLKHTERTQSSCSKIDC